MSTPDEKKKQEAFNIRVHKRLGPEWKPEDFGEDPDIKTPMYLLYCVEVNGDNAPQLDKEDVTSESFVQLMRALNLLQLIGLHVQR